MTTTQDIFSSGAAPLDERSERAQRAVRAFRAMQPGLSGYARAITGRKEVRVELAEGVPRTDGTKIFFKPPIALGDLTPHDRSKCERRDRTTKLLLCTACRIREEVLITIYHEIAHIVFGTFAPVTDAAKVHAVERAVAEVPGKFAERVREAFARIPDYKKNDYLNLSSLISPYLPVLVNALEDARVDDSMFKARKGTKVMFDAYVQSIFASGIEEDDGSRTSWSDKPLNSQALIGVFVLACRYDYKGWFHADVEAALSDARLRELTSRIETTRSAEGTYNLAFPILARLRELGFCKLPEEEPEEEQQPEPEPEEEEQDEEEQDEADDSADQPEDEPGDDEEGDPSEGDGGADAGDGEGPEGADGDSQPDGGGAGGDDEGDSDEDPSDSDADAGGDAESRADAGDDGAGEPGPGDDGAAEPDAEEERSESRSDGNPEPEGDADRGGSEGHEEGDASASPDGESSEADDGSDSGESESNEASGGAGGPDSESADSSGDGDDDGNGGLAGGSGDGVPPAVSDDGELTDENGDLDGEDREEDGDSDPADSPDASLSESEGVVDSDDVEVIDTGADEGEGGTETDLPDYGTPEQSLNDVQVFGKHEAEVDVKSPAQVEDDKALDQAIIQGLYFEKPSANVLGVREHKYGVPVMENGRDISDAWADQYGHGEYYKRELQRLGISTDLLIPETILGPALNEMRRAFSDNQRAAHEHHLKSGKINARVLGKRAPFGDQRLFQKKRLPGKRSYAVIMGIDISGSTVGVNLALAKRAATAQAELCARMGIDFAIYAHTANGSHGTYSYNNLWLDVYEIKSFDQPWADKAKEAMEKISSDAENLDGHGVEYYRRIIERHPATDKIILYYSDGKMPAANHDEELEILQREIAYCKAKQITLLGVGIRTDSPRRHGLDTVQVDDDSDVSKVVRHLQSALLHNR